MNAPPAVTPRPRNRRFLTLLLAPGGSLLHHLRRRRLLRPDLRAIVEDDFIIVQTDAFTSQLGIGYDIPMGRRLKLTPQATYISTFGGVTTFNDATSPEVVSPNLIQIGIGLTFH